jgi:two-component sensor histidine kinase
VGQVQAIAHVYGLQVGVSGPLRVKSVVATIAASVERMFGRAIKVSVEGASAHRWALPEAESIPIALAINELLTNAVKHGAEGEVRCTVICSDTHVVVEIASDGALPEDFDSASIRAGVSGLGLVRSLLPRRSAQLDVKQRDTRVVATVVLAPPGLTRLESL